MSKHKFTGIASALDSQDYGIIITNDGRVKGVWIPDNLEDHPIPEAIAKLCVDNFGIDPNTDQNLSQTIH